MNEERNVFAVCRAVGDLLSLNWGKDWGEFNHDYPIDADPTSKALPAITYRVISFAPANLGSVTPPKPRQMPAVQIEGSKTPVVPFLRVLDYMVRFTLWERNYEALFTLVEEFSDALVIYQHDIMAAGADYINLVQGEEERPQQMSTRISTVSFSLDYTVRIKKKYFIPFESVRGIDIETYLTNP
jgi:hypothetical protein